MKLRKTQNNKVIEVVCDNAMEFNTINASMVFKRRSHKYTKVKGRFNGDVNFMSKGRFIPIQLWQYVFTVAKRNSFPFDYADIKHLVLADINEERVKQIYESALSSRPDIVFDQDQLDSIILLLKHNFCKANLSVAYGKSLVFFVVSAYLMLEYNEKVLLLTPKPTLNLQLFAEFMSFSAKIPELAGRIMYTNTGTDIHDYARYDLVITNFQYAWDKDDKFFEMFDATVIDEVHRASAKSYKTILQKCKNVKRTKGGSGTLISDSSYETMAMIVASGFTIKVVKKREIIDSGRATDGKIIAIKLSSLSIEQVYALDDYRESQSDQLEKLNKELAFIRSTQARIEYISELAKEAVLAHGNGLIFFKDVKNKYGRRIADDISYKNRDFKVFYIDQHVNDMARNEVYEYVKTNQKCVVVVSYDIASTGLSINNLAWGMGGEPTKSTTTIGQFLGRFMRKHEDKDKFYYYDIIDMVKFKSGKNGFLCNWFIYNRLPIYQADKFEIEYREVNLNKNLNW